MGAIFDLEGSKLMEGTAQVFRDCGRVVFMPGVSIKMTLDEDVYLVEHGGRWRVTALKIETGDDGSIRYVGRIAE